MNPGSLSIEANHEDGRRELKLSGELDMATANAVRETLSEALRRGDAIVVDTVDVTFIDSTGLATLISARQRMGDRFTLVPGGPTRRLLELAGALGHFGLDS